MLRRPNHEINYGPPLRLDTTAVQERYALYCGAAMYAEAIGLGMKSGIKTRDAYFDTFIAADAPRRSRQWPC